MPEKIVSLTLLVPFEVILTVPRDVEINKSDLEEGLGQDGYSDGRQHHDWEVMEDMVTRYLMPRGLYHMLRKAKGNARSECILQEIPLCVTMKSEASISIDRVIDR